MYTEPQITFNIAACTIMSSLAAGAGTLLLLSVPSTLATTLQVVAGELNVTVAAASILLTAAGNFRGRASSGLIVGAFLCATTPTLKFPLLGLTLTIALTLELLSTSLTIIPSST